MIILAICRPISSITWYVSDMTVHFCREPNFCSDFSGNSENFEFFFLKSLSPDCVLSAPLMSLERHLRVLPCLWWPTAWWSTSSEESMKTFSSSWHRSKNGPGVHWEASVPISTFTKGCGFELFSKLVSAHAKQLGLLHLGLPYTLAHCEKLVAGVTFMVSLVI